MHGSEILAMDSETSIVDLKDRYGYVHAKKTKNWLDANSSTEYRMRSSPRGYALIINNYKFTDSSRFRAGADMDTEILKRLWTEMGYQVTTEKNLTYEEFRSAVMDFSSKKEHSEVDSTVVFVSTHGDQSSNCTHEVQLMTSDCKEVSTEWVIGQFHKDSLAGKPKMFFFQSCRGHLKELPNIIAQCQVDSIPLIRVVRSADTIVVFPCSPGYVSIRDTRDGSWLVTILSDVLMRKACENDLETMLHEVSRTLRSEKYMKDDVGTQVLNFENTGFSKKLFFNTGLEIRRHVAIHPPPIF